MRPIDLYYTVKPAVPRAVRLKLRQLVAKSLRRRCAASWPISPTSGQAPDGWRGWPNGKTFAFVLTHDVESPDGLDRSYALAELEMQLGVRSSFNFVPEGDYVTPPAMRALLVRHGFEVGVHDLRHDGTLYRSRTTFDRDARKINEYLSSWKSVGFRSAFMFHDLEWLKDLEVLYDASTFDTDPFEPQPDGVDTIFPFWVPRPDGSGYVELPYTLPQDSTLFMILKETDGRIWKDKVDWVAAHGGLALMNVHPDYMAFDGRTGPDKYSIALYRNFLEYVLQRYGTRAWFALPREVAAHVKQHTGSVADKRSA